MVQNGPKVRFHLIILAVYQSLVIYDHLITYLHGYFCIVVRIPHALAFPDFVFPLPILISIVDSLGLGVMLFYTTFSNNSVISWRSVLLVEETGVSGKKNDLLQVTKKIIM